MRRCCRKGGVHVHLDVVSVASNDLGDLCQEPWAVQAFDDEVESLRNSNPALDKSVSTRHGSLSMPERQNHCTQDAQGCLACSLAADSCQTSSRHCQRETSWQTRMANQVLCEGLKCPTCRSQPATEEMGP